MTTLKISSENIMDAVSSFDRMFEGAWVDETSTGPILYIPADIYKWYGWDLMRELGRALANQIPQPELDAQLKLSGGKSLTFTIHIEILDRKGIVISPVYEYTRDTGPTLTSWDVYDLEY